MVTKKLDTLERGCPFLSRSSQFDPSNGGVSSDRRGWIPAQQRFQRRIRHRPVFIGQRRVRQDEKAPILEGSIRVSGGVEVLTCQLHLIAGRRIETENEAGELGGRLALEEGREDLTSSVEVLLSMRFRRRFISWREGFDAKRQLLGRGRLDCPSGRARGLPDQGGRNRYGGEQERPPQLSAELHFS